MVKVQSIQNTAKSIMNTLNLYGNEVLFTALKKSRFSIFLVDMTDDENPIELRASRSEKLGQIHGKQFSSMSNANRAIINFNKKYPTTLNNVSINMLDYGCYEINTDLI